MGKLAGRIILTLLIWIILVALAFLGVFGYLIPYRAAENTMPASGTMVLTQLDDGTTQLTWPHGVNADRHLLEILRPIQPWQKDTVEQEVLYSTFVETGSSAILPDFPRNEEMTIRVSSVKDYKVPFEKEPRLRYGEEYMEITGVFQPPAVQKLNCTMNSDEQKVEIRFELPRNGQCRMYSLLEDGSLRPVRHMLEDWATLSFGDNEEFTVPGLGERYTFVFDVYSQFEDYVYYGAVTEGFSVTREDMLGTKLNLSCVDEGNNVYSFSWNETKGEVYEFQQYDFQQESWETVLTVEQGGQRRYTTGHLPRYTDCKFRVVALGGDTLPDSEYAATPAEVQVRTGASLVYSTVWPIQPLEIYSAPDRAEVIGEAPSAQAYCVLDAEDGMFRIRHGDGYGYIDGNYCMINLPEFIGDICQYDITNSYASLFMAHEYELPEVTGEVIVGYEQVRTGESDYLVPLLYPTALKLEKAAFAALEQGYQLKIYDSFRPQEATRSLYDLAIKLAPEPIPETPYFGEPVEDLPQLEEGQVLTYELLMTDQGRYTMDYFLAAYGSRHNQGLALDLTVASLWDGRELEMQTRIHDLSWYSELSRNNANADVLGRFMLSAGFAGLESEWWHFQDDEALDALSPKYLWDGVSPQCWMADDAGWRYRDGQGAYYQDCTQTIDGISYVFDENGYAEIAAQEGE